MNYKTTFAVKRKPFLLLLFFSCMFVFASLSRSDIYKITEFKEDLLNKDNGSKQSSRKDIKNKSGKAILSPLSVDGSSDHQFASNGNGMPNRDSLMSFAPAVNGYNGTATPLSTNTDEQIFESLEKQGQIGVLSEKEEDRISDNFFTIKIPKTNTAVSSAYLTYELYGLANHQSVSRSINHNPALGGDVIVPDYRWSVQKEAINLQLLKEGANTVMFTAPVPGIKYKVKNVKIVLENSGKAVENIGVSSVQSDHTVYLKGFVRNTAPQQAEILIAGEAVRINNGEFEKTLILTSSLKHEGIKLQSGNSSFLYKVPPPSADLKILKEENFKANIFTIAKDQEYQLSHEGAALFIEKESTPAEAVIQLLRLREKDFPTTNQGIKNITPEAKAFRIAIAGGKLDKKIKVTLPYDEKKLGAVSSKEIKSFYFDYKIRKWKLIKNATADEKTKTVTFEASGEGDYINGIISVPESPQLNAFAPTSISGLKAGDPTSSLQLMAPPTANQKGDLVANYPINIPAGINGVQPSLSFGYNSSAGNGWMGEGWDVNGLSSITVDTRWGTPEFSPSNETELYSLDGEMLIYPDEYLPHRHMGNGQNLNTNRQLRTANTTGSTKLFYLRKNHDFTIIERIGSLPTNYSWKITATNGNKSYFGGDPAGNTVIKNAAGQIVHWGLWKTEDTHGNTIEYTYHNVTLGGTSNLNGGKWFHIKKITYGKNKDYSINFITESGIIRRDISINAKQTVTRVEPYRLKSVSVNYKTDTVRSYKMEYEAGQFSKTRLKRLYIVPYKDSVLDDYMFGYYDDLTDQGQSGVRHFGPDSNISLSNQPDTFSGITQSIINPSKINANRTSESGLMIRPALGINIGYPSQDPYSHIMFGMPFGFSEAEAKNAQQLIDFNGDGIQDMIYRTPDNGLLFSRGNLTNGTLAFETPKPIGNFHSNFSYSKNKTNNWGWDMGLTIETKSEISSSSKTTTSTYLTDANADGLIDIVNDGEVWFNRYSPGGIEMTRYSEYTENMVVKDKPLQIPANPKPRIYADPTPKIDVVRVWIAPRDGYVKFTDEISVENNAIPSASGKAVYSVEIRNPVQTSLPLPYGLLKAVRIYLKEISLNDAAVNLSISRYNDYFNQIQAIPPVSSYNHYAINNPSRLFVKSGDKIYVRLHKDPNVNFKVNSNPNISYLDEATWSEAANTIELEQDNFHLNNGSYKENFLLNNGTTPILLDADGSAKITMKPVSFPKSSDGFKISIVREFINSGLVQNLMPAPLQTYYPQSDVPFQTDDIGYTTPPLYIQTSASEPSLIKVLIESDSFVSFVHENWNEAITIDYEATNNLGTNVNLTYNAVPQYPSFAISQFSRKTDIADPQITPSIPAGYQTYGIQINKNITNLSGFGGGTFYYIIKKGNKILAKRKVNVDVSTGVIQEQDFTIDGASVQTVNGISPITFFQGDLSQSAPADRLINIQVYCTTGNDYSLYKIYASHFYGKPFNVYYGSNSFLTTVVHTSINTAMYNTKTFISNNWGQFLYNNFNSVADPLINHIPIDNFGRLIYTDSFLSDNPASLQCAGITDPGLLQQCMQNTSINPATGNPNIEPIAQLKVYNTQVQGAFVHKYVGIGPEQYSMADSFRDEETLTYFSNPNPDPLPQPPVTLNTSQVSLDTTMKAIDKKQISSSKNKTTGGIITLGVGNSETQLIKEGSVELQTFTDMNGDGYPDLLYADALQSSNSLGGLNDVGYNFDAGYLTDSYSYYKMNSIGRSFNAFSASGRGTVFGESKTTTAADRSMSWSGSVSLSAGVNDYYDSTDYGKNFWIDINGDGLPDRVLGGGTPGIKVGLNLGKELGNFYPYPNLITYRSHPKGSYQINIGGGLNQFADLGNLGSMGLSINGGVGAATSKGTADVVYEDINGDGMIDILELNDSNHSTTVRYNLGNQFDDPRPLLKSNSSVDFGDETTSYNGSLTFGGSLFVNIGPIPVLPILPVIFIFFKAGMGASANFGVNISEVNKTFKDMNGDGFSDLVVDTPNGFKVNYSRIGRTNKLKTIQNNLSKGTYVVDYLSTTANYDNPYAKMIVKEVRILNPDAFSPTYTTSSDASKDYVIYYEFEKSRYDRRERENFGYEVVTRKEKNLNGEVYRMKSDTYFNTSYMLAGLLKSTYVFKGPSTLLSSVSNKYEIYKFNPANTAIELASGALPADYDKGGKEGRKMATVLLKQTSNTSYEPGGQLQTTKTMTYHGNGLLKNLLYISPTNTYNAEIAYHSLSGNIINVPKSINVYSGSTQGNLIRQRKTLNPNPNTGDIGTYVIFDGANNMETDLEYDSYGHVVQIQYPPNESTQIRYTLNYTYDNLTGKYVTKVEDNEGLNYLADYDPHYDVIRQSTDQTGNTILYRYDGRGRINQIQGPNEQAIGSGLITINYNYTIGNFGLANTNSSVKIYKAITENIDTAHPNNPIKTDSFADFTGKIIQVKKDIENDGIELRSVSGRVFYDNYGRAVKQYLPRAENINITNINNNLSSYFSASQYDESDRLVTFTDEVGNVKQNAYNISGPTYKTTETISNQTTDTFTSAEGKVVARNNYLNGQTLTTSYKYNTAGDLISVTDPENLNTDYKYNLAGRRTAQIHPDKGVTEYKYDLAGNLIQLKTSNLSNDPNVSVPYIYYKYDYANRLTQLLLPDLPNGTNPNNVYYEYAGPGSGNQTGRIVYKSDGTGESTYEYGRLGELINEVRVVQGYNINTMTFKTHFDYDSWNRIKQIDYPDGEQLFYTYDFGGNLKSVGNGGYEYIKQITYDEFEQRRKVTYGNDTKSTFYYTPNNRLDRHFLTDSSTNELLNNEYRYDGAGNITRLLNTAGVSANEMGGNYLFKYNYDTLNRLENAEGFFRFTGDIKDPKEEDPAEAQPITPLWSPYPVSNSSFNLSLRYLNDGRIDLKRQHHEQDLHVNTQNSYENVYKYISGTHQLQEVTDSSGSQSDTFEYDYNGNPVHRQSTIDGESYLAWDEQDRLKALYQIDAGLYQYNAYDDKGERTIKYTLNDGAQLYQNGALLDPGSLSLSSYKIYPNPYVVVSSDGTYTKHYFTGSTRFASRIEYGGGMFQKGAAAQQKNGEKKTADPDAEFKFYMKKAGLTGQVEEGFEKGPAPSGLYYLHTDHLGTASYVTNEYGETTQFFLNLPFGETMAEQNAGVYDNPYKFNAKELDVDTGLYYYGARYYNPRLSVWYGVDPLAEKMPSWSPYTYAFDNPVRFIDPDGRSPWDHHFDARGKFLYDDGKKSNNVIVHIGKGQYTLNQLDYNNSGTRKAVSNIIAHYADKKGLSGTYGVKSIDKESTGAHTTSWKSVFFNSKQLAKGNYNDFYNIRSTLDHEAGAKGHKNENISPYTYLAHAQVYLEQSKASDYGKSTEGNQNSVAFGFMERLWNSYENKEISWGGMDPYIKDFNTNNTGGVTVTPIGGYDGPMDVAIKNGNRQTELKTAEKMKTPNE